MDQATALDALSQLNFFSVFFVSLSQVHFVWPWVFLMLPLPWLVYRFMPPASPRHYRLRIAWLSATQSIKSGALRSQRKTLRLIVGSWIWVLLVIATSHPQWIGEPQPLPNKGRDLMLAVDISGSMQMDDMVLHEERTDRLTAVKEIVSDFVLRREGDRLGLIVFGTQAYLHVPITHDRKTVSAQLNEIELRMAGDQTAIGDAIGLGTKRLKDQPEEGRILILLTDGANTAGAIDPIQAAQLAASQQLKIYTIGIGADELEVETLFGLTRRINPSQDLDEITLRNIASATGGNYFRARSTEELDAIYRELDRLEPVEQQSQVFRPRHSLIYWPLLLIFASLIIAFAGRWFLVYWREQASTPEGDTVPELNSAKGKESP
ncbi:Ca-activated chloride channel family protein [Oceanospirillum linum]|nr:Ca-activated chloride channel family protein [Oleiphilus messinensis]SMP27550.1 Ca-activated chloride channel family protein [Oceanospirillum linum]